MLIQFVSWGDIFVFSRRMRKAGLMNMSMNISNAANNLVLTQTLVIANEPMARLFFCIHTIYKVQHT